jgi:hypothetical protein
VDFTNQWESLQVGAKALLALRPEIYGNIAEEKVELNGLLYVTGTLPVGIEECRFINLTSDEGIQDHILKRLSLQKKT